MNTFLGHLGQKLAERWLTMLVPPGALYLAIALTAHTLGQRDSYSLSRLAAQVSVWAKSPPANTVGGQVVLLAATLAASAGAGIAARTLGSVVERLALAADWRAWPAFLRTLAERRVVSRRTRWDRAHQDLHAQRNTAARSRTLGRPHAPDARHTARRTLTRIAPERPDRPTWSGDRIHAVDVHLSRVYHLDLALLWPPLWLSLPDPQRAQLTESDEALARAATTGAWALLCAPLAVWWWPAAPLAAILAFVCHYRLRSAADAHARLVQATVLLYAGPLARELGIDCSGPFSAQHGDQLTDLLDCPLPPPVPQADATPSRQG